MSDDSKFDRDALGKALRTIAPELMTALIELSGTRSQAAFGRKVGINASQINLYCNGHEFPYQNLAKISAQTGIAEGTIWWLLGRAMMAANKDFAVQLAAQPDEIREPPGRYKYPGFPEEVADLMKASMSELEPEDGVSLANERRMIQTLCEMILDAHEALVAKLRGLLSMFREHHAAAVSRARARASRARARTGR